MPSPIHGTATVQQIIPIPAHTISARGLGPDKHGVTGYGLWGRRVRTRPRSIIQPALELLLVAFPTTVPLDFQFVWTRRAWRAWGLVPRTQDEIEE